MDDPLCLSSETRFGFQHFLQPFLAADTNAERIDENARKGRRGKRRICKSFCVTTQVMSSCKSCVVLLDHPVSNLNGSACFVSSPVLVCKLLLSVLDYIYKVIISMHRTIILFAFGAFDA